MADPLPRLRRELDVMPSPAAEQPGLLIRDPFGYTDAVAVIPPPLVEGLRCFDGKNTAEHLKALLWSMSGDAQSASVADHLIKALDEFGFLESETFFEMRDKKQREFAESPEKLPTHAGSGYPDTPDDLTSEFEANGAHRQDHSGDANLVAIAAPHVSPFGGYKSYAAAYNEIPLNYADRTFIILGTSHYGEPDTFGLTRKPYSTPLGLAETDLSIVDKLEHDAPRSVRMEDYCHVNEHSIEFQTVFLQHRFSGVLPPGERLKIVPILCGTYWDSLLTGKAPESNDNLARFFNALGELAERKDVCWVLGIDLAHIGKRYGDKEPAIAEQGHMSEVRLRDEERLARVAAGDAAGYFDLMHPNQDDLRWCGYAPVYAFLRSVGGIKGDVLSYEQWNIDPESVVSFTGMKFTSEDAAGPL